MNSIIELLRSNDTSGSTQPATWKNTIAHPIVLQEGDQLIMKNAFLETLSSNNEYIYINKDLSIQFKLAYYQWNIAGNDNQSKVYGPTGVVQDNNFYVACYNVIQDPNVLPVANSGVMVYQYDTKPILIPAGAYTPQQLCDWFNEQASSLPSIVDNEEGPIVNNGGAGTSTTKGFIVPSRYYDFRLLDQAPLLMRRPGYPASTNWWQYGPLQDPVQPGHFYYPGCHGSTNVALVYDANDSGMFEFYSYTPLLDQSDPPNVSVGWFNHVLDNVDYMTAVGQIGGTIVIDMSQDGIDFFTQLGFNINEIFANESATHGTMVTQDININSQFLKPDNLLYKIQGGRIDTSTCLNQDSSFGNQSDGDILQIVPGMLGPQDPQYFISQTIESFKATEPFNSSTENDKGAYLVEINSVLRNDMRGQTDDFHHVFGVVSRQWTYGQLLTAFSDSSINYTHIGDPIILNTFDIRILNQNKTVADDLGNNNSIYLQVIRNNEEFIPSLPPPVKPISLKK